MSLEDDLEAKQQAANTDLLPLFQALQVSLEQHPDQTPSKLLGVIERAAARHSFDVASAAAAGVFADLLQVITLPVKAQGIAQAIASAKGKGVAERAAEVLKGRSFAFTTPYAQLAAQVLIWDSHREGGMGAALEGGATHKTFVRIRIPKEQRAHSALEGLTLPIDQPFVIAGIECFGPGDEKLPWSERAWCGHILKFSRQSGDGGNLSGVKDQMPERFPRTDLPSDPNIPNDLLLRVDTPEKLLAEVRRLLLTENLSGRTVGQMVTFESQGEFKKALAEAYELERAYFNEVKARSLITLPRGFSSFAEDGKMYFSAHWYTDAKGSIEQRADAFHTACHEGWHSVRRSPVDKVPNRAEGNIEEGLAELFAERMCLKYLGTPLEQVPRYKDELQKARALAARWGAGNAEVGRLRLMKSRNATNLKEWLWGESLRLGLSPQEAEKLLGYVYDGS